MNLKDIEAKLEAELIEARLKVESTYATLVEAGEEASSDLEKAYLESIDELNAKLAEARALAASFRAKARTFAKTYGKRIVIGGAIVLGIIAVGYIIGFYAV